MSTRRENSKEHPGDSRQPPAAGRVHSRGLDFAPAAGFHRDEKSIQRCDQWMVQIRDILKFGRNLATFD
jgi:hypothetical protein